MKMHHRLRGLITSHPMAVSWILGALALNWILLYVLRTEFGTLDVFLEFPLILGFLVILTVLIGLGFFAGTFTVGPILVWLFSTMNGSRSKIGDWVIILSGEHRGRTAQIYELTTGQGGGTLFRLDLGPKAREEFQDIFEPFSIARGNEKVEGEGGNG